MLRWVPVMNLNNILQMLSRTKYRLAYYFDFRASTRRKVVSDSVRCQLLSLNPLLSSFRSHRRINSLVPLSD